MGRQSDRDSLTWWNRFGSVPTVMAFSTIWHQCIFRAKAFGSYAGASPPYSRLTLAAVTNVSIFLTLCPSPDAIDLTAMVFGVMARGAHQSDSLHAFRTSAEARPHWGNAMRWAFGRVPKGGQILKASRIWQKSFISMAYKWGGKSSLGSTSALPIPIDRHYVERRREAQERAKPLWSQPSSLASFPTNGSTGLAHGQ